METPTPIWKTPEFWRKLAEEWRGPETFVTDEGICRQLACKLQGDGESMEARLFLEEFHQVTTAACFWPIGDKYRPHRAELCERIATHLATCQKTTCTHSNPETPTGGMGV